MENKILVCDCCGASPAVRQTYQTTTGVEHRDLCLDHLQKMLWRALEMLTAEQVAVITGVQVAVITGVPQVLFCCGCALEVESEVQVCPTHGVSRLPYTWVAVTGEAGSWTRCPCASGASKHWVKNLVERFCH